MDKKRTIIAAIVLLLVLIVGGAVAYFTDTDTKTNTFTIGSVDITLTEENWDATAAQDMMPGETVTKDPIVNNVGKNKAFVFMKVEVPCLSDDTKELFTYTVNSGWNLLENGTCTDGKAIKVYNYGSASGMTELAVDASTPALFNNVTLVNLTNAEASKATGDLNMVVTGYGIQAEGLESTTPTDVWGNF